MCYLLYSNWLDEARGLWCVRLTHNPSELMTKRFFSLPYYLFILDNPQTRHTVAKLNVYFLGYSENKKTVSQRPPPILSTFARKIIKIKLQKINQLQVNYAKTQKTLLNTSRKSEQTTWVRFVVTSWINTLYKSV